MIKDNVRFIGYRGFYKDRHYIKTIYVSMSNQDKQIYKWYVYSRRYLKEYTCNLIWEFLNNIDDDDTYIMEEKLKDEFNKAKM